MPKFIVLGTQWGDEGKGKIIDLISSDVDLVVRSQGGNNAGHTVIVNQNEYKFHLIPSAILNQKVKCLIGAGTVIDLKSLKDEISNLKKQGISIENRFWISEYAQIVMPYHKIFDELNESKIKDPIGTTKKGIGPCYADKINRIGIRIADFCSEKAFSEQLEKNITKKNELLKLFYKAPLLDFKTILEEYREFRAFFHPYITNVEQLLFNAEAENKNILFEGAQGTLLDINFGTYPYVTSSTTTSLGIVASAGVGPKNIKKIIGVTKAYSTRVGNGPFPTELFQNELKLFQNINELREIGTTTKRKRRIGWLDLVLLKFSVQLNGITSLALTKLDILDEIDEIKVCVSYLLNRKIVKFPSPLLSDMKKTEPIYKTFEGWKSSLKNVKIWDNIPKNLKIYVDFIESFIQVPIDILSVGPDRSQSIFRNSYKNR
jgi:adenylosuccinate synthase